MRAVAVRTRFWTIDVDRPLICAGRGGAEPTESFCLDSAHSDIDQNPVGEPTEKSHGVIASTCQSLLAKLGLQLVGSV